MKIEKIIKELGQDFLDELDALSPEDVKNRIVSAGQAIKTAKDELEANPNYQELKENIKALRSGFSAVKKRQNAITDYLLTKLNGEEVK
jgi:DNA-binding transcriptional regulator GbsR (MarR family)